MSYTQAELIAAAYQGLPYGDHCGNLDLTSEPSAIRFTWRGNRFRVSESGLTEEVGGGVLSGSDLAILAEHLIKGRLIYNQIKQPGVE